MSAWWWLEALDTLRSFRNRAPLVALAGALLAALLATLLESRASSAYALERALIGPVYGLLLPLGCAVATRLAFKEGIDATLARTRFGVDRRSLLSGRLLALFLVEAAFALLLTTVAALATRSPLPGNPGVLVAASVVGALAYGGWFALAISFGRGGPFVVLLSDWLLGSGTWPLALPFPRGHLRNLVGGHPVLELGDVAAVGCLFAIATLAFATLAIRTRR